VSWFIVLLPASLHYQTDYAMIAGQPPLQSPKLPADSFTSVKIKLKLKISWPQDQLVMFALNIYQLISSDHHGNIRHDHLAVST